MGTLRSLNAARANRPIGTAADTESALMLVPLPCPDPGDEFSRVALRAHAHRCGSCGARYRCSGAGETGFCTPLCAPCHWVELRGQLTAYRTIVSALERKRRQIEKSAGRAACLLALENKRRRAPSGASRPNRRPLVEEAGAPQE